MYHFSRSIYRELAPDIIEDRRRRGPEQPRARPARLRGGGHRLATDWHYFAKPSKTLFNDIRIYFPMSAQYRVYKVVDRYMTFAKEYFSTRRRRATTSRATGSSAAPRRAAGRRASARRCRTTATAPRTSTSPRPKRSSSPPR